MARRGPLPPPSRQVDLTPSRSHCRRCEAPLRADYTQTRTVFTLDGVTRLHLQIRRCQTRSCRAFHRPVRPEAEGAYALPGHLIGLDVLALVGALRYAEHRSVPEIHARLAERGVTLAERSVTNALARYDELLAVKLADKEHLRGVTAPQGRVLLALDGLQPDVGHEVLWVLRDVLSGAILTARSLLSSDQSELGALLRQVREALPVPIEGVVSDGQAAIRKAVAKELPGVPHQLCHFHYLREAARPLYEADRHAKKELKKSLRGIRRLEAELGDRADAQAEALRGYCAAVRAALTDDHRPPLRPSGLLLHERLEAITASLRRVVKKGGARPAAC